MADTNGIEYDRAVITINHNSKVYAVYDFIFGEYLSTKTFFDELARIQAGLINNGEVVTNIGRRIDLNTIGGTVALSLYLQTIEGAREAMSGLSKLGIKVENKLWQMLN
ncbi:MAG: hypothetical protein GY730_03230 [bacterium]|nr:hypothetical protein [bacterium]